MNFQSFGILIESQETEQIKDYISERVMPIAMFDDHIKEKYTLPILGNKIKKQFLISKSKLINQEMMNDAIEDIG